MVSSPTLVPTATPLEPGRRRSTAKHEAILRAASEIVQENGYQAATIEAVAARAGVGKQTIYRWWSSKAALYVELYKSLVPAPALEAEHGNLADELRYLLVRLSRLYRTTPAAGILTGLIADAQHESAAADALREGLSVGRRDIVTGPLRRAVERGDLAPDFDVEWAGDAVIAMIWHRLLTGRSNLDRRFVNSLLAHVLGVDHKQ